MVKSVVSKETRMKKACRELVCLFLSYLGFRRATLLIYLYIATAIILNYCSEFK